jgi:hypothetical protein
MATHERRDGEQHEQVFEKPVCAIERPQ